MAEQVKKCSIVPSSPVAVRFCVEADPNELRMTDEDNAKYPFKSLLVAESFTVLFSEANPGTLSSLRSSASSYSKRLNRKFRVFVHNDYSCIEVARIA